MIHILEKGEKADPLWGCGEEIITDDMIEALQQGKRLYITVNDEYAVVIKKDGKRKTDNPEATDTDTISRQAAIDAIKTWGLIDGLSEGQAIEILADEEKLPSIQPDSKELSFTHKSLDTISRQAVLDAILQKPAWHNSEGSFYHSDDIINAVNAVPPSPSRPHDISKAKFSCPICGAEMEVTVDEWDEGSAV